MVYFLLLRKNISTPKVIGQSGINFACDYVVIEIAIFLKYKTQRVFVVRLCAFTSPSGHIHVAPSPLPPHFYFILTQLKYKFNTIDLLQRKWTCFVGNTIRRIVNLSLLVLSIKWWPRNFWETWKVFKAGQSLNNFANKIRSIS